MFKEGIVQKAFIAAFISFLLVAISCSKDKTPADVKSLSGTEVVFISDPTEMFMGVKAVYPTIQWAKYLDKTNTKSDYSDKYSQAFNLGSQIIDCLLAIQAKDFATAETIAKSMKQLAEKLNISAKIENKAVELQQSIKSKADLKARKNTEELRALVINALEEISGQQLDLALQYGAWVASYSKLANIVNDTYDKNGANLLSQKTNIEYFLDNLGKSKFKDKESVKKSITFLTSLKASVYVATEKGEFIKKEIPAKIYTDSIEIVKLSREGK